MLRRSALALTLAVAAALASAGAAAAATNETLWLDTHATTPGTTPSVSTTTPLQSGAYYFANVTGTYSIWSASSWLSTGSAGCGTPEASPMFPSPGVTNSKVGLDSAVIFAAVKDSVICPGGGPLGTVPQSNKLFQIDQGSGAAPATPIGGARTVPDAGHSYNYLLRGQGSAASFRFVSADNASTDNYGQLRVVVSSASKEDCKKDGYKQFGVFKNQGDCVSYFATDGRNAPAGG